jgi:glutathione S-transferase
LLPADPAARAAARLIIARFNDKAVPAFYRMLVQQDASVQAAAAAAMDGELQWLVDSMHPQGPFALGQELGLVDCAIAPFLIRLCVLEHYRCGCCGAVLGEGKLLGCLETNALFYLFVWSDWGHKIGILQRCRRLKGPTRGWCNLASTTL